MTPSLSSDSVYEVKTSKAHPPRSTRRLLAGVLGSAVMVVLTLTVSTNIGTAGAATPATTLTVCKGGIVTGRSRFSVNGGASFAVGVGHCASRTVPAGENLVTELVDPTGATDLRSIAVTPMSANVVHKVKNSKSQAGYAKINVVSGTYVTVSFADQSAVPALMVCAVAGTFGLNGQDFSFTEQAGGTTVGPFSIPAEGENAPEGCGKPTSYPGGTNVTVSESAVSGVNVSNIAGDVNGITVVGGYGKCGEGGTAVVPVRNKGMTFVYITNDDCGPPIPAYLEICTQAGGTSVGTGPWTFTITGNGEPPQTVSVLMGECSSDLPLPVGDYTVTETLAPPDYVSAITGDPTAPISSDLGTGSGVFAVSTGTTETATFTNNG
jgi:hypothetical protein